jgi:hypothetical protein
MTVRKPRTRRAPVRPCGAVYKDEKSCMEDPVCFWRDGRCNSNGMGRVGEYKELTNQRLQRDQQERLRYEAQMRPWGMSPGGDQNAYDWYNDEQDRYYGVSQYDEQPYDYDRYGRRHSAFFRYEY